MKRRLLTLLIIVFLAAPFPTTALSAEALPPEPPSDLTFEGFDRSTSEVTLSWTDNSSNEKGFLIERSLNGGLNWTTIGTKAANVTTFVDVNALCSLPTDYRVSAGNDDGLSTPAEVTGINPPCMVNGGFEDPLTRWFVNADAGSGQLSTSLAYQGNHIMFFSNPGDLEFVRQTVGVSRNVTEYDLFFYMAGENVSNGGLMGIRFQFLNNGVPVFVRDCAIPTRGTFDWQIGACSGSAVGDPYDAIRLTIGWLNVSEGRIGFDEISLFLND